MLIALALVLVGFVVLMLGAEVLVRGASALALAMGISPLVVGLTVVALGTSAPEIAVSVGAALGGTGDLALGNVIGSNIFNVLFILGLSALITPLVVHNAIVRRDVPVMIAASVLVWWMARDGILVRVEAVALCGGLVAYIVALLLEARASPEPLDAALIDAAAEHASSDDASASDAPIRSDGWKQRLFQVTMLPAGAGLLVIGAGWLVDGAKTIALGLGVSELVVGLTLVAAGTSLPEVATSVLAGVRGQRDLAVGNVIGSNIFNLLAVLGAAGVASPDGLRVAAASLAFDLPVMVAVAVACLPIVFTSQRVDRWEGAVFMVFYLAFVLYVVFNATEQSYAAEFKATMFGFVGPLTLLTLGVMGLREWRYRQQRDDARETSAPEE
ncbi:sodium:calcium antiporter [Bradymonadaceae bacterium TMQ3]|uniref:Calcium/sodium antiporter n=1 Tax=Lujinxingia sediminis TaxID=2480984 RepID=A0ABY0CWX5_9DELT|nr:calcium/sodium antiporter [Lujinxingia sediminis]RDV39872.1 sodium:calcium antiporter [Bradymonadaceae bacterium TMQ3]RVU48081.1 calcium/sodium antiporter [Lujinxingia sediminis]TXC77380.1 calcium/sodium antiporter [Bradymonadales bacterium TMQ1]